MSKNIRITEPSAEMLSKIIRAREAIAAQKPRYIKCPYCQHNSIVVYEDTRGHVETKCKKCGMCLKIGCPAIERYANKRVHINDSLCVYCGLCKQVCKFSALDKIDVETSKGGLV